MKMVPLLYRTEGIPHLLTQVGTVSQVPRKHVAYFSPNSRKAWLHLNLAVRPLDMTRTLPFKRTGCGHLFLTKWT